MRRIFVTALLFHICLQPAHASLRSGADHLINQVDPNLNIGIQVIDLTSGTTLYQRNNTRLFTPASNMKLFSDAAALMVLGPDYRFRNQLSVGTSHLQNGVLQGNLYLRLPGDPSFSRERLANLLNGLKKWHIQRIEGHVIIDSAHANIPPYAPGRMAEDLQFSYGAPIAPVMIDANRMLITVNPAERAGKRAIVEVEGVAGSVVINNQIMTKPKGSRCGVSVAVNNDNEVTARGCISVGQWAVQQRAAIRNPLTYAKRLIKQQLIDSNIVLTGNVVLGKMPQGTFVIESDHSKPIAQLMADTLKPSDNLYADSLFLHAAEKLQGAPVTWQTAQPLVKKFITQQTGIPMEQSVMTDGSGLSHLDRITPEQTAKLLTFLYDRFPLAYEYIAALPVSGRDGTLQKRFKRPDQQDMVRAKTGYMKGIMSLSGYLYTANAHTLAFAIYVNRGQNTKPGVAGKFRYTIDALCDYFLKQNPGNNTFGRLFSLKKRIQYQQNPTQAELQRRYYAKWRQLEILVKRALQGQAVSIVFRGNELLLQDYQTSPSPTLNALRQLRNKYSFAVALTGREHLLPDGKVLVLISDAHRSTSGAERIWTIREAT